MIKNLDNFMSNLDTINHMWLLKVFLKVDINSLLSLLPLKYCRWCDGLFFPKCSKTMLTTTSFLAVQILHATVGTILTVRCFFNVGNDMTCQHSVVLEMSNHENDSTVRVQLQLQPQGSHFCCCPQSHSSDKQ